MIKYDLICRVGHEFEGWFSSSSDYDVQRKKRLVQCPECGSAKVEKAIMAPAVATGRVKDAVLSEIASKIRAEISENCEDVGDNFAGSVSPKQAKDLVEEGVAIAPLPDLLTPRPKKKLN